MHTKVNILFPAKSFVQKTQASEWVCGGGESMVGKIIILVIDLKYLMEEAKGDHLKSVFCRQ